MSSPGQNSPVVTALPAEVPGDWRMVRRLWLFSVNAAGMSLGTFLGAAIGGLGLGLGGYPGTACAFAACRPPRRTRPRWAEGQGLIRA